MADGNGHLLERLTGKLNHRLERKFPEQRLFLRSEEGTRFILLSPVTQVLAWSIGGAFVAWSIIATAVLIFDSIGSGSLRDQSQREQNLYEQRLQDLSGQRDMRVAEAAAAQERFNLALEQISNMQSELLDSEDRRKELETGIDVIQATLRRTMKERDRAREQLDTVLASAEGGAGATFDDPAVVEDTLSLLTAALDDTAVERDDALTRAADAEAEIDDLIFEQRLRDERNDQIFAQLEDAVTISLEPLDKMFDAAGMPTERILSTVRAGYSGTGGPLMPMIISTKGAAPDADMMRANQILEKLDTMNMYRIAAEKLPFSMPVRSAFRYTSGFGSRWGRMHEGIDMAAGVGTPVYAPADGVVTYADWQSGYGRLIKIRHEFGVETRYGHLSAWHVREGQRVSRGDLIGDMGNSGRSTGPHLHYEIRVGGDAINPMTYIKAGRNVF